MSRKPRPQLPHEVLRPDLELLVPAALDLDDRLLPLPGREHEPEAAGRKRNGECRERRRAPARRRRRRRDWLARAVRIDAHDAVACAVRAHEVLHAGARLHKIEEVAEALVALEVQLRLVRPDVLAHLEGDEEIEVRDFLAAVAGGPVIGPDFREGYEVQKLVELTYRSSRERSWVTV